MSRRKRITTQKNNFDLSGYKIIEDNFPFSVELYRFYIGDLVSCIKAFELSYGKIDGLIYTHGSFIGIVSSQNEKII